MSTQVVAVTNAAVAQVGQNADPLLKQQLLDSVITTASFKRTLTTDDVWQTYEQRYKRTDLSSRERSTLGFVMRQAAKYGHIASTKDAVRSNRPSSHGRFITIFKSNLIN